LPEPPSRKRTEVEKYGLAYWLGLAGLVGVIGWVGWFGWNAWLLRDVWRNVYVVNDPESSETARVAAAWALAKDERVTQRQFHDLALSRVPPERARYLLAEGLTYEAVSHDPRGYVLAVARSEGWPPWLRAQLARPLVWAALLGVRIPDELLAELEGNRDPVVSLLAAGARQWTGPAEAQAAARGRVAELAESNGELSGLAAMFRHAAVEQRLDAREAAIEGLNAWLRVHHPDARRVWAGWRFESDGRPVPVDQRE
jgi:hypothetical protein